jgi:hypothetical protein
MLVDEAALLSPSGKAPIGSPFSRILEINMMRGSRREPFGKIL